MPLLNYTTQIDAFKTISEISKILASVGASAVLHNYDDNGSIVALSFKIKLNDQEIAFRLPTSVYYTRFTQTKVVRILLFRKYRMPLNRPSQPHQRGESSHDQAEISQAFK